MEKFRTESDSLGEMKVPQEAYWGAQTQRAVENFPISGIRFPRRFLRAIGLIKKSCVETNVEMKLLDPGLGEAIARAAQEVIDGKLDDQFPLDIFQTGSGTSTNMNANEVMAARAAEILGGKRGDRKKCHPNDHVNMQQSSNDVVPSAIHVAALEGIEQDLRPALLKLRDELQAKSKAWMTVIKIGRTHLQDATPIRLGQEFGGYAAMVEHAVQRLDGLKDSLGELAIGGTAVGTGINAHPEFGKRVAARLAKTTGLPFREASNHFEAQGSKDALVEASGVLKTIACSLMKIANDIRWLGSGPRCGIGEIKLPAVQPGSSIMPGKVNPVICESVTQVAAQVIGNDAAVTIGGQGGNFELNVYLPLMAHNLLESIALLASVSNVFAEKCVSGLEADRKRCEESIEQSLAMCTALAPHIGYDAAAKIAKKAYETGKTVREIALSEKMMPADKLARVLDPAAMTEPSADRIGSGGG